MKLQLNDNATFAIFILVIFGGLIALCGLDMLTKNNNQCECQALEQED
jgi:hypothetical protein